MWSHLLNTDLIFNFFSSLEDRSIGVLSGMQACTILLYLASIICMWCPLKDNGGPFVYKKVIMSLFDEGWGAWYIITYVHVVLNTEKSCAANSEHG